jgi:hypothetical protein
MPRTLFLQLPLSPGAALESTGNVPLAGASLAAAAGLPPESVFPQDDADLLGDRALSTAILSKDPAMVCFTLYSWNVERSLHICGILKEKRPDLTVIAGGPEVFLDNSWLLGDDRIDAFVSGEGEPVIGRILEDYRDAVPGGFLRTGAGSEVPGRWPNPYLSGYLDPASGDSVYVETVRGCASSCIYCSYRKSSPVPRTMHSLDVLELLEKLRGRQAGEIVFLDPTFNSRKDLEPLLDGMAGMGLECFCELRGEDIDPRLASKFARAGFGSVEIGLQSIHPDVLTSAGREGNSRRALEGAVFLRDQGVVPTMDLILGLPGESPSGAVEGAAALRRSDLHREVQVFFLSVLPGTELRSRARDLGIEYMERPPYYVTSLPGISADDLKSAREAMADILGYDLDPGTRPLLFDGWPGTEEFDLDSPRDLPDPLSFRHGVLQLRCDDFWSRREKLFRHILRRRLADPYCVLDLVLVPGYEFPTDVLDLIRSLSDSRDYSDRTAAFHGTPGNLRTTILLPDFRVFDPRWLSAMAAVCRVVTDVKEPEDLPDELWTQNVHVRLTGEWDITDLADRVPAADQVLFRSWEMERLWTRDVLGLC